MIVAVDSDRVDGLNTGVGHRLNLRVVVLTAIAVAIDDKNNLVGRFRTMLAADDSELEQELLDVAREPLAVGGVGLALEQRIEERPFQTERTLPNRLGNRRFVVIPAASYLRGRPAPELFVVVGGRRCRPRVVAIEHDPVARLNVL